MKNALLIIAIGLCLIVAVQDGTEAYPPPSAPRSVPVIVQDVMQPSRMVAVTVAQPSDGSQTVPAPIPLDPGKVFVLTAATELHSSGGAWYSVFINRGSSPIDKLGLYGYQSTITVDLHHTYPTGVRFGRNANGQADLAIQFGSNGGGLIAIYGYITDDF